MGTCWRSCANCTRFGRSLPSPYCFRYIIVFLSATQSNIRVMPSACKGSITNGMRICIWSGMPGHSRMGSFMVVRRWNIRCIIVHHSMVVTTTVTILLTWANLVGRCLRWIVRCRGLAWLKLGCRLSLGAFSVLHAGMGIVNTSLSARSVRHRALGLWLATRSSFRARQTCSATVLLLLVTFGGDNVRAKICMLKILAPMQLDTTRLLL